MLDLFIKLYNGLFLSTSTMMLLSSTLVYVGV
nr:MAG TPA: hypothetical protein [Caudoviricetes sp.]DAJ24376.1 MAG TPA: hypothetical protein [Caudoviricetes sp.]